jgi:DNA-binding NarL/FixJ family response regulator
MTRIVVADDHSIFRDALVSLLSTQADFSVVGEAPDGATAARIVRQLRPDVLLLDLAMSVGGLDALRTLAGRDSPTRVILLTAAIEPAETVEAFKLGARGLVLKEQATAVLFAAIRAVIDGQYWYGREGMEGLRRLLLATGESQPSANFGLTSRELEIVSGVVQARPNKEIADRLGISERTVKHHLTSIFDKVGMSNRLELALFALHHGLAQRT